MERPVVAIVQARMGSTRLPGKTLAPVLGRPLLELMLERVRRARRLDRVVVATTDEPRDDELAAIAEAAGVEVFRGSEQDVLDRFRGAAEAAGAETVVRLTADCPLMAPEVIDRVVGEFERAGVDFVTNAPPAGRTYPDGMDVEVFTRTALDAIAAEAREPGDREHVTPALQRPPWRTHVVHLDRPLGHVRITIDHAEDLERVRSVFEALWPRDPEFGLDEILALVAPEPAAGRTGDSDAGGRASEEFWEEDYLGDVSLPSLPDAGFPFERSLSAALARHAPVARGALVLEVGCAPAKWLAFYAHRFGAQVAGIEYTRRGAELSRRNLELLRIAGEIRNEDFFAAEPTAADLVLSLGFIEHFDDLDGAFARHVDFLAPGGRLAIGVPNYRGLLGVVQRWANPAHLALHNVAAMEPGLYRRLAAAHGLVVEHQGHLNGPDPIIIRWGRRRAVPAIRALQVLRRIPGSGRLNASWASSYLLTVMRRP